MRQLNVTVISAQAVSSGGVASCSAIPSENLFAISAQIIASGGAAAGTLKLQGSNDVPVASNAIPTNWSDIPSASIAVSAAGIFLIPKTDLCYQYVRVLYTASGNSTITVNVKGLGA